MVQQMRQALRSLRRASGLTVISVLTIGVGVGAATALFSVVKAVLLNQLPYEDPERLVWIAPLRENGLEVRASLPDFDDWREQSRSFDLLGAYTDAPFLASGGPNPERTQGAMVTEDFFDVLGAKPMMGRFFSRQEHQTGTPLGLVVIGHGLWQGAYGGDPQIIGRTITLMGLRATVIGVMPRGFSYPSGTELWVSARSLREGNARTAPNFRVIGRLRNEATLASAGQELEAIVAGLKQQYPSPLQPVDVMLTPLRGYLTGSVRTPLLILLAAVGLLLLIVCVNVANLLLVRVVARSREFAVRTALGAGTRHLFQGLLTESLLLALVGGGLGIVLAVWSMDLLKRMIPDGVPRAAEVQMDLGVITFALVVSTLAGVLFGTLPSWRATRVNVQEALQTAPRGQSRGRQVVRLQSALMICEVAFSLMLVASAGLLISSFSRLNSVDPGFRDERALAANLTFPMNAVERQKIIARYQEILARTRALPGVAAAGLIRDLPFDPIEREVHFTIEGQHRVETSIARWQIVSPGLMETLQIPLLRGRRFTDSDSETVVGVALVSEELAQRYWPGRDPIGERVWFDGIEPGEHWLTIIGIVGDVRQAGLVQPAPPLAYVCYSQLQNPAYLSSATVVVKPAAETVWSAPVLREVIRRVHPEAAVTFRSFDEVLAAATARQRFQMQVLCGFAAMALVLGLVGLYGVMSYVVTSNRGEIGIRMALGGCPNDVFRSIVWRALKLTAAGCAIGLAGCVALRGVLSRVVFGVGPGEPAVLATAVVVMFSVALLACWAPARRAMVVDIVEVLRGV